jgi:hypothetical protein
MFAGEVTRVALDVGSRGILGGQAYVPDVEGVWQELTDNVGAYDDIAFLGLNRVTGEPNVLQLDEPGAVDCAGDNCCGRGR